MSEKAPISDRITIRARVTGRVQGVAFRAWTQGQARALGLDGWVMNRPDGSVLAVISGPAETVARLVELLDHGPPAARVASVETERMDETPPTGFRIAG